MSNLKRIEDPVLINKILRDLSRKKSDNTVTIYCINNVVCKGMLLNFKEALSINCTDKKVDIIMVGETVKISFILKESYFVFDSSIIEKTADILIIEKPQIMFSSFNRLLSRYKVDKSDNIYITISDIDYEVNDINTMGLSFISDKFLFKEGEYKVVKLVLNNASIGYVDGYIKYSIKNSDNKIVNGFAFENINWHTHYELYLYIFKRKYPYLKSLGDYESYQIKELFHEYLKKKCQSGIDESFRDMVRVLKIIHNKPEISSNLVYCYDDKLLTTASALRIYESTFLGHQLVSIPQAITNIRSKTDVYFSITDYLMNHMDFEYYVSYFFTNLSWHKEMFQHISSIIRDKQKVSIELIDYIECDIKSLKLADVETGIFCSELENYDEFKRYCNQHLSQLEINTYSYDQDVCLTNIKNIYNKYSLDLDRKIWKVCNQNTVLAYVVCEAYSSGLNLFNILDMCRIYYCNIESDKKAIVKIVLKTVAEWFSNHGKQSFNVITKNEGEHESNIIIDVDGIIQSPYPFARIIANKEGGAEYWKLLLINAR